MMYWLQTVGVSGSYIGYIKCSMIMASVLIGPMVTALADYSHYYRTIWLSVLAFRSLTRLTFYLDLPFARSIPYLWFVLVATHAATPAIISIIINVSIGVKTETENFGTIRLWGAVGLMFSGMLTGVLVDVVGPNVLFAQEAILQCVVVAVIWYTPSTIYIRDKEGSKDEAPTFAESVAMIPKLLNGDTLLFFFMVSAMGMCMGVVYTYVFIRMIAIGGTGAMMGFAGILMLCSEVPFFKYSQFLLDHIDPRTLQFFAMFSYAARMFFIAYVTKPYLFMLNELFHGISYSISHVSCAWYCDKIAPPGVKAYMQAIRNAIEKEVWPSERSSGVFYCISTARSSYFCTPD